MSGFSNTLKHGWHPDKDKDFKKQVVRFSSFLAATDDC